MITRDAIDTLPGKAIIGADGQKLGKIDDVYVDDATGNPTFATINTGLFGLRSSFVPLDAADFDGDTLRVPYDSAKVKDAPNLDKDEQLSSGEESKLYEYYGLSGSRFETDHAGYDAGFDNKSDQDFDGTVGHDTSGPTTDNAMTLSEEQLKVDTQKVEAGRARLKKYVVTENVTQTVPVSREEVRIEREPITDGNIGNALDGPAISEEEHEVILHAEKPVVDKEAVPVERVRLDTEQVTTNETVTAEVAKEQIELEGDADNIRGDADGIR